MIDVTGVNILELVKKVYDLSRPQGLGMLHFDPSPLTDGEAKSLINEDGSVHLDYVRGRACKFHIIKEEQKTSKFLIPKKTDKFFIRSPWYDHTDEQLVELLSHVDITYEHGNDEHAPACNCDACRAKQGKEPLSSKGGLN